MISTRVMKITESNTHTCVSIERGHIEKRGGVKHALEVVVVGRRAHLEGEFAVARELEGRDTLLFDFLHYFMGFIIVRAHSSSR